MPNQDISVGSLARLHTVQEVAHMISCHLISLVSLAVHFRTLKRRVSKSSPSNTKPSFGSNELYAGATNSGRKSCFEGSRPLRWILEQDMDRIWSSSSIVVMLDTARSDCGIREILAKEPLDNIDPVSEKVGNLSSAKV